MNPKQRQDWVEEVLREVLIAAIQSPELRGALIFKGAWILNLHLQDDRHSMDIDAAAGAEWVGRHPDLNDQAAFFEKHFPAAVRKHFENQNPVRFGVESARVERNPLNAHPRGWDMLRILLTIHDRQNVGVRGLPPATIEVSAPETFGPHAIVDRTIHGISARVYALHRIAGEKLRAYLTSLPAYRRERGGGEREIRVKDLHDLARIVRERPTTSRSFWRDASLEFKLACGSRYVDCQDQSTFRQEWNQAKLRYEQDVRLSRIPFAEVETALDSILAVLEEEGVFPLTFTAPPIPN